MEGRNREVRRLWESQGLVVSRLKRVRFGPVFLTANLRVGRWREMDQKEVDILGAEVALEPIVLPELSTKIKERINRMQRKMVKPVRPFKNKKGSAKVSVLADRPSITRKRYKKD